MKINTSIIVITKNEELNIDRCLNSVVKQLKNYNDWEIILVDSDSSDRTIEFALKYPCRILKIISNSPSAALGRAVGFQYSKKDYLLFLDGDMELQRDWFKNISEIIRNSNNEVAGVIGIRRDYVYTAKDKDILCINKNVYNIQHVIEAKHFGGAIYFKKQALDKVGGYDIRLTSNEEPELHSRLIKHKYKIIQIPIPMINHYLVRGTFLIKLKNVFRKRSIGMGLGFKYSFYKGTLYWYFKRQYQFLLPIFLDIVTIYFFVLAISINKLLIYNVLFLQLISFSVTLTYKKPKRFLQSKLLVFPFIRGLIYKNNVKYKVVEIK